MRSERFWEWYENFAAPKLTGRDGTFRKMFEHLDTFDRPVHIVETGCIEDPDNWGGNGCSTILFDRYARERDSSVVSFDIVREKVELARTHTGPNTTIICCDSVAGLTLHQGGKPQIDLLYLDASHLIWEFPVPAQHHHLAELFAALPALHERSMVAVDDSPANIDLFPHADVGGKGALVAKYLFSVGADLAFLGYQAGWTNPTAKIETGTDIEKLIMRARAHVEADRMVAASPLYNLLLTITLPPKTGHERIARGEACHFFARLALANGRLGTAADWYNEALVADPRATDYRLELATKCLSPMGSVDGAVAQAQRAAKIEPGHDRAWRILGALQLERSDAARAIRSFDKQIELCPDDPDALLDRCTAALDTEDYDLVEKLCLKVIGTPREADAWHIHAMVAYRQNRHEDAICHFDLAIAKGCRDVPLAHWHKSQALESIGRYVEAWRERAWRKDQKSNPSLSIPMKRFTAPLWHVGARNKIDVGGARGPAVVHVHAEAGSGDNICMVRYLRRIAELGFKVRYEAQEGLRELVAYSFPDIEVIDQALDYPGGLGLKNFDYHIPIGELQNAFGTSVDDAAHWSAQSGNIPYLRVDPIKAEWYRPILGRFKKPKIGLCWSSGIRFSSLWLQAYGRHKSMHFSQLAHLMDGSFQPVSLQVGPEREQMGHAKGHHILDLLPDEPTWGDTAALISQLDLVVTVDTSVAHLAGALGKPVWVMMHTQGSWHWMVEQPGSPWNERSPWYPTARIFRQAKPDEWRGVVERVASELRSAAERRVAAE